jgi:hypothetical protein
MANKSSRDPLPIWHTRCGRFAGHQGTSAKLAETLRNCRCRPSPQVSAVTQVKAAIPFGARLALPPLANCLIPRPNEGLRSSRQLSVISFQSRDIKSPARIELRTEN